MTTNSLITTDTGKKVEAKDSVNISASSSTDIIAFYAEWFIKRPSFPLRNFQFNSLQKQFYTPSFRFP